VAGVDRGGHAALLVGGAAAVHDAVDQLGAEGIHLPQLRVAHLDGVDVRVEGDDVRAAADAAEHVAEAVDLHLVVAELLHLALDAADDLLLAAGERLRANEVAEELDALRLDLLHLGADGVQVHVMLLSMTYGLWPASR
jgi:hypothetical protein